MKKAIKIVLLVLVVAWALLITVGSIALHDEMASEQAALQKQYDELKAEYDALKADEESESDITIIRGLAYELLFDFVFYGEEYDMAAEIDKRVEQYDLDDFGEAELLVCLQVLIEEYEIAMENLP